MTEQTIAKLVIAGAGIAVFLTGVRTEIESLRWVGIILVTIAFLMRFIARRGPTSGPRDPA